jgi:hypothetical protein
MKIFKKMQFYRYRDDKWKWGNFHLLPNIVIGWGAGGIAVELKWLTFVLTLWQKSFLEKERS